MTDHYGHQCIHPQCTADRVPGTLLCTGHAKDIAVESDASITQLRPTTTDPFDEFTKDPFAGTKPDPIVTEEKEAAAREMREMYLALRRQNFTEAQAMQVVSASFTAVVAAQVAQYLDKQDGAQS